jgi:hypothetical protein
MGRWLWGLGLVASLTAVAGIVACRQLVGITDHPPTDLTSTLCGLPYGTSVCASCVQANCCTESTACAGDPTCEAYFSCVGACAIGDWQCRAQCLLDDPVGAAPGYAPLTACVSGQCEAECGLTCGGLDYFSPPNAAAECQTCLGTNDCAAEKACATSVGCVAYAQCMHQCSTPDCRLACTLAAEGGFVTTTEDAGITASRSPYASTVDPSGACNASCAVGNNWTCLGHVNWPSGTTGAVTLTSRVVEQLSGSPLRGINVSLCQLISPCSPPVPSGTSDMQGNVTIDVPASALGFPSDDYVQITASSGSILPTNYFLGYPVSRPLAPMAQPYLTVLTPADLPLLESLVGLDGGLEGTTGLASFEVLDCNGFAAPGATVTMEPQPAPSNEFYLNAAGTPSLAATATGSLGIGGFPAVPPGTVTLTATPQGLDRASSRTTVLVQAGAETTSFMFPAQ